MIRRTLTVLLALAGLALASQTARAATSADATIFNRATLTYDGGTPVTVGVGVKVGLVGAAPTLSTPGDDSEVSGNTVTVTYTIFSNANGKDNYDLSANSANSGVNAPGTIIFRDELNNPITDFDLGAAITGGDNVAANTIIIPAGSEVNLDVGTTIRIPAVPATGFTGGTYEITGITPGVVKTLNVDETQTTVSLTLVTGDTIDPGDIPAGTQVGEEVTITMEVPTGVLTAPPTPGTHTVTLTVDPDNSPDDATDDVEITVTQILVTMTKSVAMVDTGGLACDPTNGTVGSFAFFPTVLDVDSGDCIVYKIIVSPSAGQPALTSAIVEDTVPEHTTYVTDSLHLNGVQVGCASGCPNGTDGGTLPLAAGTFEINSPNSGIDDGSGNDGDGEAGVVDAGATAELTFRVVVSE